MNVTPSAAATPTVAAARRSMCGRIRPTTSITATTLNGNATHVTHSRCAESGRCRAWGRMPTLTRATASSTVERPDGRADAAALPDGEGDEGGGADEHQEEPQEQRVRRRQVGEPPPRRDLLGHRLQAAVEATPRRRAGQLPPGAQPEHGIDEHALDGVDRSGHHEVHPHRQQADARRRAAAGRRAARCRQSSQPTTSPTAMIEVGPERQGQPGQDAGDQPRPPLPPAGRRGGRRGRRRPSPTASAPARRSRPSP